MILVTYDVSTANAAGKKRLRQVARCCMAHGTRVQNSVFECSITPDVYVYFQEELKHIIDEKTDSLRFYHLGNDYSKKIVHLGAKPAADPNGLLIL